MIPALTLILPLLAFGYLARRFGRFPDSAADVLNRFVIDVCLPALLLRLIPTVHMRWELAALVAVPWFLALLSYALARLGTRLLGFDRATAAALFLCLAIGNTSFLGFPLCGALLGEAAIPLAAVYDQFGSFLLLSITAPIAVATATGFSRPSKREVLLRIVKFPPFIALLIALVPFPRPAFLDAVLAQVGAALVPVAIFAVGLRLRITPPRPLSAFALGLLVKLGLFPLLVLLSMRLLSPPHAVFQVAVLESAMPASVTAGALAMAAGLAPELAAALVGWGVIASLITVPLWAALLH
jgi:malate permease and related proteins